MDQILRAYPVYAPDQVLTNRSLNDAMGYTDQQNRHTRSKMIGNGIICGLDFEYIDRLLEDPSTVDGWLSGIRINAGYGSTVEGFLLNYSGAMHRKVKPYAIPVNLVTDTRLARPDLPQLPVTAESDIFTGGGSVDDVFPNFLKFAWELIPQAEETAERNLQASQLKTAFPNDTLNNQVLVLYLEIIDVESRNCTPNTCDERGIQRQFRIVPMLVPKTYFQTQQTVHGIIPPVQLKRLPGLHYSTSSASLKATYSSLNAQNYNSGILPAIDELTVLGLTGINKSFEDYKEAALERLTDIVTDDMASNPHYLYLFFNDLSLAINEFVQYYNCFMKDGVCGNAAPQRWARSLVLGSFPFQGAGDPYRYFFIEQPSVSEDIKQRHTLLKLYMRIWMLITNYNDPYIAKNNPVQYRDANGVMKEISLKVQVVPSRYAPSPLGRRAIPYYYRWFALENQRNYAWWNALDCDNHNSFDIYHNDNRIESEPVLFTLNQIGEYDFFRIEGHIGMPLADAEAALNNLIHEMNLPFRILTINVDLVLPHDEPPPNPGGELPDNPEGGESGETGAPQTGVRVAAAKTAQPKKSRSKKAAPAKVLVAAPAKVAAPTPPEVARIRYIPPRGSAIWPYDAQGKLDLSILDGAEPIGGVYRGGTFILIAGMVAEEDIDVEVVVSDMALPWDLEYLKLAQAVSDKMKDCCDGGGGGTGLEYYQRNLQYSRANVQTPLDTEPIKVKFYQVADTYLSACDATDALILNGFKFRLFPGTDKADVINKMITQLIWKKNLNLMSEFNEQGGIVTIPFKYNNIMDGTRFVTIGIAGHSEFELKLNGSVVAKCDTILDSETLLFWRVFQISFRSGMNYINLKATGNGIDPNDCIGMVICDAPIAEVMNVANEEELNIIFKTISLYGVPFDAASCPVGWSLVVSDPPNSVYSCVQG